MIRTHDFNTEWWGEPVGIVTDAAFFSLPASERESRLDEFAWVEYRVQTDEYPDPERIGSAGFFHVDTQVAYRIGLRSIPSSSSRFAVRSASEGPLELSNGLVASFPFERYRHLPGITTRRLDERYSSWGRKLIVERPDLCIAVLDGTEVQGWFLSRETDGRLNLTLAMLATGARITGLHLFEAALRAYDQKGWRVGWATFSVENLPVLNILAALGARFTRTEQFWLRLRHRP